MLFCTTLNSVEKPTRDNVADLRICGSLVPSGSGGINPEMLEKMQNLTIDEMKNGGMDRLMKQLTDSMPKLKMPWVKVISHKDLKADDYVRHFEKIGKVELRSNPSSSSGASSYESFCDRFYIAVFARIRIMPGTTETAKLTIAELTEQA